jgi:hypothetical protein
MTVPININQKIEIINQLSELFPKLADEIFSRAEEICSRTKEGFSGLDQNSQSELVLNTILNSDELITNEIQLIIEINNFLNKENPKQLIKDCLEEDRKISNHPFFNINIVANASLNQNLKSELEVLQKAILVFFENVINKQLEINFQSGYCNEYQKKLFFTAKIKETEQLQLNLQNYKNQLAEIENNLSELYLKNCNNLKKLDLELKMIRVIEERNMLLSKMGKLNQSFAELFTKMEKILFELNNFKVFPVENFLDFPELISQFTTYLLSYPLINNFKTSLQFFEQTEKEVEKLLDLEKKLLNNFSKFLKSAENLLLDKLSSVGDKKKVARQRFIEPIEKRFSQDELEIINKIFAVMF